MIQSLRITKVYAERAIFANYDFMKQLNSNIRTNLLSYITHFVSLTPLKYQLHEYDR